MNFINIVLLSRIAAATVIPEGEVPLNIVFHSSFGGSSHIKGLLEVANDLGKRGHNVSYAAQADNMPFANGHDHIKKINFGNPDLYNGDIKTGTEEVLGNYRGAELVHKFDWNVVNVLQAVYEKDFPPLLSYVDEKKPDLMVCDFVAPACQDIAKLRGIPMILGSQVYDHIGLVSNPYITKSSDYVPLLTKDLTFFERLKDFVENLYINIVHKSKNPKVMVEKRAKFGIPDDSPFIGDLRYAMVMSVSFMGFEVAQAIPPNLKIIGPIKSSFTTKMPDTASKFMDKHSSVVYVGFGSHSVLNLRETTSILEAVIEAMELGKVDGLVWGLMTTTKKSFPETVTVNGRTHNVESLLKNENPNFLFYKSAPQAAILKHKSTKLFINHAGLESIYEAMNYAVPMLSVPFFFDQPRNARKLEMINMGKTVPATSITSKAMLESMIDIIDDSTGIYSKGTKKMQAHYRIQSRSPTYASEIMENYAYLAKACRPLFPDSQIPCELQHLLPQISSSLLIAQGADVFLFLGFVALLAAVILVRVSIKLLTYLPQKPDPKIKKQ